ncbi:MAG TPA: ferrous iron transport protein A [Gemmatales bacterium]|mgnify:CR=1 FL=1|nr:ferrous iron transport protein A [Gemmatales bacterium]
MLPLECLQCNEQAEIADVVGDPSWVARLADLGVQSGAQLRMVAPGTTCLFELGQCRLCLRTDPSNCIYVRPLSESARASV